VHLKISGRTQVIFSTHFFVLTLLPYDSNNHLFFLLISESNSNGTMNFIKQVKPVFTHLTLGPRCERWRISPLTERTDALRDPGS
jgi:hypothetical protein